MIRVAEALALYCATSRMMCGLTWVRIDSVLCRIACFTAVGELLPCAMMQMPLTPSNGIPPYSSGLAFFLMARKASRASQAPAMRTGDFISSFLSQLSTARAVASMVLRRTLPKKPSQITTSTGFSKMSWPSTFPRKFRLVALSKSKTSLVNSFPFSSSVPIDMSPMEGFEYPSTWRE